MRTIITALCALAASRHLNERPATVYGKLVWPDKAMLEAVARL